MAEAQLFARSAGRCEFDGCNKNVLEHSLTLTSGNFSEKAHIVAFREQGPRGGEGVRPNDINSVDNLMLLCAECHKLIDDHPKQYSRALLEQFKAQHEERILRVTGIGPDRKTAVLVLKLLSAAIQLSSRRHRSFLPFSHDIRKAELEQ